MRRFKSILLVASGVASKPEVRTALRRAAVLAEDTQASLKVVDVMEALPTDANRLYRIIAPSELETMLTQHRSAELEKLIAPVIRARDVDVSAKVLVGTPYIEIIQEVLRDQHDLVIKAATGSGGRKRRLLGSTDMHLMRESPCAVWLIKPTKAKRYARILAAVDPEPGDEEKSRLNRNIMDLASSLAESEHSELHIVHAWFLYEEALLGLLIGNVGKLLQDTRRTHRKWLAELVSGYVLKESRTHVHLVEGKAKDVIPALARKKRVELIVMGTLARTGLPQRLIGHTAETVLGHADCSVLTVKPEDFVSPVALKGRS